MTEHRYSATTVLGLLADSHGRADTTRRAVDRLIESGAQVLLHLGDVCDDSVLDALAGLKAHVVFGNCDGNARLLGEYARSIGLEVDHPCGRLLLGDRSVVFAHGDDPQHEQNAISACADYFCHGHTHRIRDERANETRIVNPGALFRAGRYTVGRLEPAADRFDVLEIEPAAVRRAERF